MSEDKDMCFSAEVSFSAAVFLTTIGAAAIYVSKPKHKLLALIPLLFALQQLSEGLLWLKLGGVISPALGTFSQFIYMFFAFIFWPVWAPLAFWFAEDVPWRRGLMAVFLVGGIALSVSNLWLAFSGEETAVKVIGNSLSYIATGHPKKLLYFIFVVGPMLLSSLTWMWMFGVLVVIGYALTSFYHPEVFASVWCFFTAVISSSLLIILWKNSYKVPK